MPLAADRIDVAREAVLRYTALHWAAGNGHDAVVWALLDIGKADINPAGRWDVTPFQRSVNGDYAPASLSPAPSNRKRGQAGGMGKEVNGQG